MPRLPLLGLDISRNIVNLTVGFIKIEGATIEDIVVLTTTGVTAAVAVSTSLLLCLL